VRHPALLPGQQALELPALTRAAALALALLLLALLAAPAGAQEPLPDGLVRPERTDVPPPGRTRSAEEVLRIAAAQPAVRRERARVPDATAEAFLAGPGRWRASFLDDRGERREIAQVLVDDRSGAVLETWTGFRVAWVMARGYDGAFGRSVTSPWIWGPLCVLFLLPFLRRPLRLLHADLLVLVALSVPLGLFVEGRIEASTPLVYPPLLYLLGRTLWIGLRRRGADEQARRPLALLLGVRALVVLGGFLLAFRAGLNVLDSNVIDVGYSGVIGADRLAAGEPLYGGWPQDNARGDTYGPVAYAAYVPFEQLLPWSGEWDELPAAHAAALAFDLACVVLLFLLGRRLRGPALGVLLAYAWLAFPFTLLVLNTNANDALVAALLLAALLAATHDRARGALLALAGLTKLAPLALAPLVALHRPGRRPLVAFAVGFAAACAAAGALLLATGSDLATALERSLGYQATRDSPFSVWGLWGWPDALQRAVQGLAVALALVLAVVPRRRDVPGLAALAAAVLLALQLGLGYWFFAYVVWTLPLILVALLGRAGAPARSPRPAAAAARSG
jgi:hypothetical protein